MSLRRDQTDHLTVDGLRFSVRRSTRRRTVGITVKRDGELVVAAPARASTRRLEAVVRDKLPWVRRKLAEFEALGPPPQPRRFVAGELFPYLGRDYPLVFDDRPAQPVALVAGTLAVDRSLDGSARAAVVVWYQERAREHIERDVARLVPLVGAAPATVVVRDLGKRRWGVCDHRSRTVSFHWHLVTLPPDLIEYVVVHELTHLHEPNHAKGFWRRVEDVLPECRQLRRRLRESGDALVF
ncbi:MAG: M48 family metallopeptidase [Actinobacteria bacterium]|nr:M48 family metallopeptidase [Actinomycetota bacterium]